MNKGFAQAWDEVAAFAEAAGGVLGREGHRFSYRVPGKRVQPERAGLPGTDVPEVEVWATENTPQFGVRVGAVSARAWTLDGAVAVAAGLLVVGPEMAVDE